MPEDILGPRIIIRSSVSFVTDPPNQQEFQDILRDSATQAAELLEKQRQIKTAEFGTETDGQLLGLGLTTSITVYLVLGLSSTEAMTLGLIVGGAGDAIKFVAKPFVESFFKEAGEDFYSYFKNSLISRGINADEIEIVIEDERKENNP